METQKKTIGRLLLESIAMREVCACLYYDLADSLGITSTDELIILINGDYSCPVCDGEEF